MCGSTCILAVVCVSSLLCVRGSAQNPPPTQTEVQTAHTQQGQQRAAIETLEAQIAALERATTLLSRDPADQAYLASVRSMLADSKRQLEATKKAYAASLDVLKDAEVPKSQL